MVDLIAAADAAVIVFGEMYGADAEQVAALGRLKGIPVLALTPAAARPGRRGRSRLGTSKIGAPSG